jgi:hypothetical protein
VSDPTTPREREGGLVELVGQSARTALEKLEARMDRGLTDANAALATPEGADLRPLLSATDLPEVPGDGPLGNLGVRLDREADLLRNVALRELSRVGWMERLGLIVMVIAFVGELVVAACATLSAVMGADGRGTLFALAALTLAGAAAGTALAVSRSRAEHRTLALDALSRARVVEERIFRLALVMEWRTAGAVLYQDALARLERECATPPP